MSKFKRASLEGGSEELFRSTRPPQDVRDRSRRPDESIDEIAEPRAVPEKRLKTVHLSADEVELLIQAIQVAKYPERAKGQKIPLYDHERYDELRAKLQNAR